MQALVGVKLRVPSGMLVVFYFGRVPCAWRSEAIVASQLLGSVMFLVSVRKLGHLRERAGIFREIPFLVNGLFGQSNRLLLNTWTLCTFSAPT